MEEELFAGGAKRKIMMREIKAARQRNQPFGYEGNTRELSMAPELSVH